ncbi:SDH family Clp fold serine proteinase [Alteriqipengyuania lutimaris]|uniref:SDH family Clp fold serine proteinase n=1 Tax=Alteriqipengyuania lutimaris TaxID=1538146 RepID=UPI0015F185D9|nr:serine protease [Alteriqipengyuania lutimaris]MBB3034548.1 hypothetical protein [Alteriqipengyuania lutimaris]
MNHASRVELYKIIEADRKSRVLALVNSERIGLQTQIAKDAVVPFVNLLDDIGPVEKLSVILDTNGGQTSAAWRLINLIHSFCEDLEVIIPTKAMSAGTLMSLGADRILMTKQAALGPIDPSLDGHALAPMTQGPTGHPLRVSVSAEAVRGYIDEVKKDITDPTGLAAVWTHLATQIHPLVLGEVFRAGTQIRLLANNLIKRQVSDEAKQEEIIQLLCSDSGSHDYTINRRQAAEIGLNIEKPSGPLYKILVEVTKSYNSELKTLEPYSPQSILAGQQSAQYELVRGLIESTEASYGFMTEGRLSVDPNGAVGTYTDQKSFEGWRRL